ncbi:hypothetical protein C477_13335 [Haloterrigena salina JCM 13891]|uniref:DUF1059 domain-containing protein n=1 Tax=Haloterrigena salina JCM 13891 TaxID=1227488 RepID=M0C1Q8_9EURY|nr:hypothetical protein [Haloterrigena salina]ELZ17216.1 hypothetical protein C477_13335 [Haloterrigena salina JCM 13891]
MADTRQSDERLTGLEVACDTEVSGCVFRMRTEVDDRDRLLEITRDHVSERHGTEYSLEEIDEQHVTEVEV